MAMSNKQIFDINDNKIQIKLDRITSLEEIRKFLKRECGDIS